MNIIELLPSYEVNIVELLPSYEVNFESSRLEGGFHQRDLAQGKNNISRVDNLILTSYEDNSLLYRTYYKMLNTSPLPEVVPVVE